MNEQERSELEWLKSRQAALEQELRLLATRLAVFEQRAARTDQVTSPSPARPAVKAPEPAPQTQPKSPAPPAPELAPPGSPSRPPPIPPILPLTQAAAPGVSPLPPSRPQPVPEATTHAGARPQPAPIPHPIPPPVHPSSAQPKPVPTASAAVQPPRVATPEKSFEMRLGTFWLVRIGIVMLLTGLVFFGNLAYHHIISKLGPGGKVSLLYLASGLLLGAGWWWQRKEVKESLKNYAQVLFAGGLAAVYFTTYAAHHVERLRIISSAGWDGLLLLLWAGFMVWIADRKKSQVLALFAVLLAYYTSVITTVGLFTLYSNLVLTAAAVLFLVRNRWATVSFVSLAATYSAYGYWRFCNGQDWHWALPENGLWTGTYFLIGYWVIFTAAVFLSRDERFAGQNRNTFLTANNGAFFSMFLLTMYQVHHRGFWKFAVIYGTTLIALAAAARYVLRTEPLAKNSYLTQGLLLATVGIISNPDLAGLNLALILAAESMILLMAGQQRKNLILLIGAYITALLAVGWGMDGMMQHERHGLWLAIGLGAVMIGNALLAHRETRSATTTLRPQVSYFTVLALAVWLVATWNNASRTNFSLVLAIEAIGLIASIYLLRVREFSLLGLGYLTLAQVVWVFDAFFSLRPFPWWNPVAMILLCLALCEWWKRQRVLGLAASPKFPLAPENLPVPGKNLVLFAAMQTAVTLTGGWDIGALTVTSQSGFWLPLALGALLLADTLLQPKPAAGSGPVQLRLQPAYSTALALVTWLFITWHHTSREHFPLILATEGLALSLSFYVVRRAEISLLAQAYIVLAQLAWITFFCLDNNPLPPWWNPILLIAISLGLSHWWQKQKQLQVGPEIGLICQAVYSLAIVGVLFFWLSRQVGAPTWLVLSCSLAIGLTAYGVATRAWLLAAFGQIFMLISAGQFLWQLAQTKPAWYLPLAPLAALGVLSFGTVQWFTRRPEANPQVSRPLLQLAMIYRWAALLLSLCWVCKYIPERERIWVFGLLGLLVFLAAGWLRKPEALWWGAAYSAAALAWFWLPLHVPTIVYWPNLLALIALLGQQQIAKRLPDRYNLTAQVHGAVIIVGSLSLWFFLSKWVLDIAEQTGNQGGYLTASWSILALTLFTCGILVRERVYRWLGLAILACAVGRVTIIDVWKLETIYQVLSFMALGIVLLVLGFIYNKYQEKIKEWL